MPTLSWLCSSCRLSGPSLNARSSTVFVASALVPAGGPLAASARAMAPRVDARTALHANVPRDTLGYLSREFASIVGGAREAILPDIDAELSHHKAHGILEQSALIEAFITEQ
jgi:hypothetical protein